MNIQHRQNNFSLCNFDDNSIKINVDFSYIEKNNCYNIVFLYTFPPELSTDYERIIFMNRLGLYDKTIDTYYEGDIIRKNNMTEELIKLMMLNDENLKTHSGHVTSECYRLTLINIIKLLWD